MTNAVLAFDEIAGFQPAPGPISYIDTNEYGIFTPAHSGTGLLTEHTYVCAGIALINDSGEERAGMMHIFSDANFFLYGEEAVRQHVRNAWERFASHLAPTVHFSGAVFGGRTFPEYAAGLDPQTLTVFFNKRSFWASDEYKALVRTARDPSASAEQREAIKRLQQEKIEFLNDPDIQKLRDKISSTVSTWINDELFQCALRSGFVSELKDFRFQDAPHDALIDMQSRRIVVGQERHRVPQKVCFNKERIENGVKLPTLKLLS